MIFFFGILISHSSSFQNAIAFILHILLIRKLLMEKIKKSYCLYCFMPTHRWMLKHLGFYKRVSEAGKKKGRLLTMRLIL